jgi:hypothetical protein
MEPRGIPSGFRRLEDLHATPQVTQACPQDRIDPAHIGCVMVASGSTPSFRQRKMTVSQLDYRC